MGTRFSQWERMSTRLILVFSLTAAMLLMGAALTSGEPEIASIPVEVTFQPPYYYYVSTGEDEPPDIPTSNCQSSTGVCTLRAAVTSANQDLSNISRIFLPAGTYTLTYGTLPIQRQMEFVGAGAVMTVIHVQDQVSNLISAAASAHLTLYDLTLTGGSAGDGGAIENNGTVTLVRSVITENDATIGGGIWNNGTLTLVDSAVNQNRASESDGAITNVGSAMLIRSMVSGNDGGAGAGGILNYGTLEVYSTTISSNVGGEGGGLNNRGNLTVEASTIALNEAISGNGGGLYNGAGLAKLLNSTLSGNMAGTGGAIYNLEPGTVWLASVTIANNAADGDGGGIFMDSGAGLLLRNTILSENTAGGMGGNCRGILGAAVNTLVSSNDCALTGTVIEADPLLGALQDNGGPTQTHALSTSSPALNAVPSADCTDFSGAALVMDQRGMARLAGAACDIGAFEFSFNGFLPLVRR
jgi:hypothetical protein